MYFKTIFILLLISSYTILSCQKEQGPSTNNLDELIGIWINPHYTDSTITFERNESPSDTAYFLSFETDNKLIENKNIGWCGTPPISYSKFNGNWNRIDSIINIEVAYWGGMSHHTWKMESLRKNELVIKVLSSEYE